MVGELTWARRLLGLWIPLAALFLFALFPFAWMAVTSIKTNAELYDPTANPLWIRHPSLEHYIGLIMESNFLTWIGNTMLVALVATTISLLLGVMLAYPLARMRFAGAGLLAITVAVTYLVPQTLLFVPMADLITRINLSDSLSAVMLTYPTLLVPFCAWLLIGYFKTVPKELEEAALIDGGSRWRAMTHVILPLCTPGLLSAGIFAFTLAQNEFLYALLFLNTSSIRTVPVGVTGELIRGDAFYWGQLMAAALLGSLPVVFIYSFFVKYYVAGLTTGSVKA
jgi:multiple sugar transport system permease protein